MKNRSIAIYLTMIGALLTAVSGWFVIAFLSQPEQAPVPIAIQPAPSETFTVTVPPPSRPTQDGPAPPPVSFDGQRAYEDVITQVAFGPRIPGSDGHAKIQAWMRAELESAGWQVEVQESEALGHPVQNVIAQRGDAPPQIILGAHYDSRLFADKDADPLNRALPVPAANDGASGVAVLLELARVLPRDTVPVWLVFFDAEDNGRIEGWDWILGSREFVSNNPLQPRAVIIVDMVGDADLNIFKENHSNPGLTDEIWTAAAGLGYGNVFIPEYKYAILDDHIPFLEAGLPAVDIIDFDYPYHHTLQDTPDKVSAASLQAVGETLQAWVMGQRPQP